MDSPASSSDLGTNQLLVGQVFFRGPCPPSAVKEKKTPKKKRSYTLPFSRLSSSTVRPTSAQHNNPRLPVMRPPAASSAPVSEAAALQLNVKNLRWRLAADVTSAAAAGVLVAPVISIIDR